jgi:DNA polymerase-1
MTAHSQESPESQHKSQNCVAAQDSRASQASQEVEEAQSRPIFLLFDGHAVIYRAFYALPKLTDPRGRVVNAVFGFTRIVLSAIKDFQPKYLTVTFDHPEPTFRHQQYEEYKAHRPEMPEQLQPQIPLVKQVTAALNIPQFEQKGYEADDLIGTISHKIDYEPESIGANPDLLTIIVSGDRDIFQLVDNNTHVWVPGRSGRASREYDAAAVQDKLGVRPDQVVDMKALMGDSSDNIPGIKGIGPKTAVKLLKRYDNLDQLYRQVAEVAAAQSNSSSRLKASANTRPLLKGSLLKKLQQGKKQALLSRELAQIKRDVPLELDLEQCQVESYDKNQAVQLLQELNFQSLISELPNDQFESEVQASLFA